jgi:hypothetical protein
MNYADIHTYGDVMITSTPRRSKGFLTLGSAPWLIAAVCAVTTVMFFNLYNGVTHEYSKFRADVASAQEQVRLDNERQVQAVTKAARQVADDYSKARAALAAGPRVVRVRDACSGSGILPGVSANATSTEGLHVPQSGLGAERSITGDECEIRLNWAVEDAATIEWMKAWVERTHEASKQ